MLIDREPGPSERCRDAVQHHRVRTHARRPPEHPEGIEDSQWERSLWEGDELDTARDTGFRLPREFQLSHFVLGEQGDEDIDTGCP